MINMGNDAEITDMRCVHLNKINSGVTACRRPKIDWVAGTATLPEKKVRYPE
jgi:hypothetical protein